MSKITAFRLRVFAVLVALTTGVGLLDAYLGNPWGGPSRMEAMVHGGANWFLGGCFVWGMELLYVPSWAGEWLRQMHYLAAILLKSAFLIALVVVLTCADLLLLHDQEDLAFLAEAGFLRTLAFAFVVVMVFQAGLQVISFIGGRTLVSFLLGRYYRPVREEKIFMFLDLAGSTPLAERMGDVGVQRMITKFFFDIDEPIVANGGDIHRYVGDQIVVTWPLLDEVANMRAVRCCFAIRDRIAAKAAEYERLFGVVPSFRIGLHGGHVVISQCGDRKKELSYFGDTVNAAARIQGECKAFGTWLLLSAELAQRIRLTDEYRFEVRGDVQLRGRTEKTELLTVLRRGDPPDI